MNISTKDVDLLIFDLDGVIYKGSHSIPYAVEAIDRFQSSGKDIAFFTNNSTLSKESYLNKLSSMGIYCNKEQIFTSSAIASESLADEFAGYYAYVFGEIGLINTLKSYGIRILNEVYSYEEILNNSNITCSLVVAGLDRYFSYNKLSSATQLINRGAEFYATNIDPTLPTEIGFLPGAGALIKSISTTVDKEPKNIFGKPSAAGINQILNKFGINKNRAIMFGDRLDTDILSAKNADIKSVLVLTGAMSKKDLEKIPNDLTPDLVINNLAEF